MKPGPAPSCQCGDCRVCGLRIARAAYYARNRRKIIRTNVRQKRERKTEATDQELDQRAVNSWRREWGCV